MQTMRLKLMKNFARWQLAFQKNDHSNNEIIVQTFQDIHKVFKNNYTILLHSRFKLKIVYKWVCLYTSKHYISIVENASHIYRENKIKQ